MKSNQLPVLGFLGAGAIVSAMVRGFCERAQDTPITWSYLICARKHVKPCGTNIPKEFQSHPAYKNA